MPIRDRGAVVITPKLGFVSFQACIDDLVHFEHNCRRMKSHGRKSLSSARLSFLRRMRRERGRAGS